LKLSSIAKIIEVELFGDVNHDISNVSNFADANKSSIIFITDLNSFKTFDCNSVGAILTSESIARNLQNCNLLISKNPRLSFAKLTNLFKKEFHGEYKIVNSNGLIFYKAKNSKIGKNFNIGSNSFIGSEVNIGHNVMIGNNVSILSGVSIGNDVCIESGTIIGSEGFGNVLDGNGKWVHISHLGSVSIGNNVSIGANCTIDRGTLSNTVIGDGVIIDNQVHIAHNVKIGNDSAIAAKTGIAGSSVIGSRNMIGGMVGIIDHIEITDNVTISATTTVYKNIPNPGRYTGIMPISEHSLWKRITFWITKLDKMMKLLKIKNSKL